MHDGWVIWKWSAGEISVAEVEHMFGFDLILYREGEGRPVPVAILCRQDELSEWEQYLARQWAIAREIEDWGRYVNLSQSLSRAPME